MAKATIATEAAPQAEAPKAPAPEQPKASTTVEQHAEDAKTPDWLLASTKAFHGWAAGKEISRADYDAAVEKAGNCSTGSLKDAAGKDTSGLVK